MTNPTPQPDSPEAILTMVRAGVDPDTKQLHITMDEALTKLEAWYTNKFLEDGRISKTKTTPKASGNQVDTSDELSDYAKGYDDGFDDGRKWVEPSIADALEFRREQYGWTATKMAAMLDIGKSHYSEIVSGKRQLPVNSIRKAYAIGIPAAVLLQEQVNDLVSNNPDTDTDPSNPPTQAIKQLSKRGE